jgi:hypothetical protein
MSKHKQSKQSKQSKDSSYTDIRTGIVYTNIGDGGIKDETPNSTQPYLDAFIPPAFLKTYFGKEKE